MHQRSVSFQFGESGGCIHAHTRTCTHIHTHILVDRPLVESRDKQWVPRQVQHAHTHMHAHTRTCTHTHWLTGHWWRVETNSGYLVKYSMHTRTCMHTHAHAHTHTHTLVDRPLVESRDKQWVPRQIQCAHTHMHAHTHTCTCTHTHMHAHTRTYTHTHIG